jgi:xanthine dehydrogenase accessory factor
MNELEQIVTAWERQTRECVLATVVATSGSTYRRAGAHMLSSEGDWLAGAISGGCLERDVLQKSWWHTSSGRPALVVYDASTDDEDLRWGFGLGCNGTTSVLLERVPPDGDAGVNLLGFVRNCLRTRGRGVLATVLAAQPDSGLAVSDHICIDAAGAVVPGFAEQALAARSPVAMAAVVARAAAALAGRSTHATCAGIDLFLEVISPARSLVICGSGFDVAPLVALAQVVGWHVTVADARLSSAAVQRLCHADRLIAGAPESAADLLGRDAAAVVMTHNYKRDRDWLDFLLRPDLQVGYIGVLGPRQRTARLLDELPPSRRHDLGRVHGPVGLDLGAEGAQEIALAIVAEVQAFFAGRTARSLSPGGHTHEPVSDVRAEAAQ